MTRERLNLGMRILLAAILGGAFLFSILAARPAYRFLGNYSGLIGTPQSIDAEWNQPAAYLTLEHPAVVGFPEAWQLPDQVCVVVRLERDSAPTSIPFPLRPAQIQWDDRPAETVVYTPDEVYGRDYESNGKLIIGNTLVAQPISLNYPYRVSWFGQESLPIYPEQGIGGLMCYHFLLLDKGINVRVVPFTHRLIVRVKNVSIIRQPAFDFDFNTPTTPPGRTLLKRVMIEDYLKGLSDSGSFAVQPMSTSQQDQRARERALAR